MMRLLPGRAGQLPGSDTTGFLKSPVRPQAQSSYAGVSVDVVRFGQKNPPSSTPSSDPAVSRLQKNVSRLRRFVATLTLGTVGIGAPGGAYVAQQMSHLRQENVTLREDLSELQRTAAPRDLLAQLQERIADLEGRQPTLDDLEGLAIQVNDLRNTSNPSYAALLEAVRRLQASVLDPDAIERRMLSGVQVLASGSRGSGVMFQDATGAVYILTNHHVVHDGDQFAAINSDYAKTGQAPRFRIRLGDGQRGSGQVLDVELVRQGRGGWAASSSMDMAVLRIVPKKGQTLVFPHALRPSDFRDVDAERLRPGEPVFAVGAPIGLTDNVTQGGISHVNRWSVKIPGAILLGTDAGVNPGNSGGGLFDRNGKLVGINSLNVPRIVTGAGDDEQVIPINDVAFSIRVDSVLDWLALVGLDMHKDPKTVSAKGG